MRQTTVLTATGITMTLLLAAQTFAGRGRPTTAPAVQVTVRHPDAPTKPAVFDVGDTIEVVADLSRSAAPGAKIAARWLDSYGRLVADETRTLAADGQLSLRFPVRACVSTGNRIELLADGQPLGVPTAFGCAPQHTRPLRDWYVFPWNVYPAGTGDTLRSVGVNGGMAYKLTPFDSLIANDLRFYVDQMAWEYFGPYKKRTAEFRAKMDPFLKEWNEQGVANTSYLTREPCLSDPETMTRLEEHLRRHVVMHEPYKPVWYNLQDEGGMAGQNQRNEFCYGPHCLAGLRTWLKEQYGALEALNAAWGVQFAAWDDVTPLTSYEVRQREKNVPLAQRRLGPWCDHRAYMDLVMTRALARARDYCHTLDPGGLFGMTGTQDPSPWPAFDYSLIPTAVDIAHYYDYSNAIEIARSFHPRHGSHLFPYPGWSSGNTRVREDWYYLFHGLGATGIWDKPPALLDADGRPTPKVLAFKDTWLELQHGIGRLFINARRDNDPIAVAFSQPTLRVREMLRDDPAFANATWAWDDTGAIRALEDLGFQYEFVADWEAEQGLLTKGGFRLFFLLNTVALSDRSAAAVAAWVKAGGVLVTDDKTGLFDEHGRGRTTPILAALTAGKPEQTSPPFDVFACERGKVVLAKPFSLNQYARERLLGAERVAAAKATVGRMTYLAGLAARIPVLDQTGRPAHAVEVFQFTDGPARYIALLRNPGNDGRLARALRDVATQCFPDPIQVTVQFSPKPRSPGTPVDDAPEVYNVRAGTHLGQVTSDTTTLEPWSPAVYALLPYRVSGVEISAPAKARRGEIVPVRLAIRRDGAGTVGHHVLRVDVFGPDGALRTFYSRNLDADAGRAEMTIPFALNDAPGSWRLRVRDVATGTTGERILTLE
jgi:hypothetical protein